MEDNKTPLACSPVWIEIGGWAGLVVLPVCCIVQAGPTSIAQRAAMAVAACVFLMLSLLARSYRKGSRDITLRSRTWRRTVVSILLATHAVLLTVQAYRNAPTFDEIGHLSAGLSHWTYADFSLYRVNPPLVRSVCTLPIYLIAPAHDWKAWSDGIFARSEFSTGHRFAELNGYDTFTYITIARLTAIPFVVAGGLLLYVWASELFDRASGFTALVLWVFCPNILGWGGQMTPDAIAAVMGLFATWRFWKWLTKPTLLDLLWAGFGLGLAELSKSTWILLFALWPVYWGLWRYTKSDLTTGVPTGLGMTSILFIAILVLNAGYGFENTGKALRNFQFVSQTLGGEFAEAGGGNRFRGSILGDFPVPLPENYVRGIDVQKRDFEKGKWSYLNGQHKRGGWWHYYVAALLMKSPIGFLVIFATSIAMMVFGRFRRHFREELLLLGIPIAILLFISVNTGFNRYIRYVIPSLPFLYLSASRIALSLSIERMVLTKTLCVVGLGAGIASSLSVYPWSISFFNIAVGGSPNGASHLLDANIDWGQDLLELERWTNQKRLTEPLHLKYFGSLSPRLAGINFEPVPCQTDLRKAGRIAPTPGWYAVSVNYLMGYCHQERKDTKDYTYFQNLTPVHTIGYSILVYHIE